MRATLRGDHIPSLRVSAAALVARFGQVLWCKMGQKLGETANFTVPGNAALSEISRHPNI